jgi:hypothetical protein
VPRAYERFPRPQVGYYETRFPYLSQGDIFDDIPFATTGPELLFVEDAAPAARAADVTSVILQPVIAQRAIIVSPTCDFRRPSAAALQADPSLEPYTLQAHVTVAPVLPLADVLPRWGSNRDANLHLLRLYDALRRYMYLPPLPALPLLPGDTAAAGTAGAGGEGEQEWVADLSRLDSVAIGLLTRLLDRRLAQLTLEAAQQLQYKLVMALTAAVTNRDTFQPPLD